MSKLIFTAEMFNKDYGPTTRDDFKIEAQAIHDKYMASGTVVKEEEVPFPFAPFTERYGVTASGDIISYYNNKGSRRDVPKTLIQQKAEYYCVGLALVINGERYSRNWNIHSIVCTAFRGEKPSPKHEVRHLDGDRYNNNIENLMWGTKAENEADKIKHGSTLTRDKNHQTKLDTRMAKAAKTLCVTYGWSLAKTGRLFDVSYTCIQRIVSGDIKEIEKAEPECKHIAEWLDEDHYYCVKCDAKIKPTGWKLAEGDGE